MITKKEQKAIRSLGTKKNRKVLQQFVAEGEKTVRSFLAAGYVPVAIYGTVASADLACSIIKPDEMRRISQLKNPATILAVFPIQKPKKEPNCGRILVLDNVSDPGNLGTLIRLCHWFGIEHVVCSPDSVDCYNPKVVQATMGSLAKVHCHYLELIPFLTSSALPLYGTFLSGDSIHEIDLPKDAIIVFGSEAQGISPAVAAIIPRAITIPRGTNDGPESLNIATAAAIVMGTLMR